MMPVSDETKNEMIDYRQKYRNLKRKFKLLIYENECFQDELKKAQRKFLKVSRDKSFLLDRLLQYETVETSSSDSDATVSSDSEVERKGEITAVRKKKPLPILNAENRTSTTPISTSVVNSSVVSNDAKKKKSARKTQPPKAGVSKITQPSEFRETLSISRGDGHMTSEEIERHLQAKQPLRDLLPEKAPLTVPAEMFSNEPTGIEKRTQHFTKFQLFKRNNS